MNNLESLPATSAPPQAARVDDVVSADHADLVEDDLLVEEISIDGMCGVY